VATAAATAGRTQHRCCRLQWPLAPLCWPAAACLCRRAVCHCCPAMRRPGAVAAACIGDRLALGYQLPRPPPLQSSIGTACLEQRSGWGVGGGIPPMQFHWYVRADGRAVPARVEPACDGHLRAAVVARPLLKELVHIGPYQVILIAGREPGRVCTQVGPWTAHARKLAHGQRGRALQAAQRPCWRRPCPTSALEAAWDPLRGCCGGVSACCPPGLLRSPGPSLSAPYYGKRRYFVCCVRRASIQTAS
jgi:hypothetical protein